MPALWTQVRNIVDGVLEVPPQDRSAYLDRACPQPELRRYVESLIASYDKADQFLERVPIAGEGPPQNEEEPAETWIGRRIGAYRIEEEIGTATESGLYGYGTVWELTR